MGYELKEIALSSIDTSAKIMIVLKENEMGLNEVIVRAEDPISKRYSVTKLEAMDITSLASVGALMSQKLKKDKSFVQAYVNYQFSDAFVGMQKKSYPDIKKSMSSLYSLNMNKINAFGLELSYEQTFAKYFEFSFSNAYVHQRMTSIL